MLRVPGRLRCGGGGGGEFEVVICCCRKRRGLGKVTRTSLNAGRLDTAIVRPTITIMHYYCLPVCLPAAILPVRLACATLLLGRSPPPEPPALLAHAQG